MSHKRRRIGILGYGAAGRFLAESLLHREEVRARLELAFVWNRSEIRLRANEALVPSRHWLVGDDVGQAVASRLASEGPVDLIVEISHPTVVREHGVRLLDYAELLVGSSTAFASEQTERSLRSLAETNAAGHGCYIATGAAWGVADIARMNAVDSLEALSVSMAFHPDSLHNLGEPLRSRLAAYLAADGDDGDVVLYEGPVRSLCELAPNNVNTMACLCLAASRLGFDGVVGRLVAGKKLKAHIVEIQLTGRGGLQVSTRRYNPARPGAVTGDATFASFLGSLLQAGGRGNGVHFC